MTTKTPEAIFEEMTREELISVARTMHQSISELQADGTRLVNELRGFRAFLGMSITGYERLPDNGNEFCAAINALIGVRFASDCKHGTPTDQIALPNGTGDVRSLLRREEWHEKLEAHRKAGTLSWADILRCEIAEAMAESDPDRLCKELLDSVNVGLKFYEAVKIKKARGLK